MSHVAVITLVSDERGERAVVQSADQEIWITDELWRQAQDPARPRVTGDLEIDGDQIAFGTPGEGVGRLHYRRIGHDPRGWHVAERVQAAGPNGDELMDFGEA
jgi:hypothetical protein